jgi:hypothetical protein
MPYQLHLAHDGRVLWNVHRDEVDADEIVRGIEEETEIARTLPGLRIVVFDYRAASMRTVTAADLTRCAEAGARQLIERPELQHLGLVPQALEYGLSRVHQAKLELLPEPVDGGRVTLVRTLEEAEAVIGARLARED